MRASLSTLCENFIANRDIVISAFPWESSYIHPVCAAIFIDKRLPADEERLKKCHVMLKEETSVFSTYRGTAKAAVVSMLAVSPNPEEKLHHALEVYDELKEHFSASQYLPVAATIVADLVEPSRYQEIAARTRRLYKLMKSEHPFLTSAEDSVFAAMLAMSALSDDQVVAEVERCYQRLKPEFLSGNAVQSLTHVLAIGEGGTEGKCERTMALFRLLKEQGNRYGTSYELSTLGVLALLPEAVQTIADDVSEVSDWLADQKGYGVLGLGKKQRLMHAGMLVTSDLLGGTGQTINTAALGATISLIAAQQCAIIAAIAASTTAASANSGGH